MITIKKRGSSPAAADCMDELVHLPHSTGTDNALFIRHTWCGTLSVGTVKYDARIPGIPSYTAINIMHI